MKKLNRSLVAGFVSLGVVFASMPAAQAAPVATAGKAVGFICDGKEHWWMDPGGDKKIHWAAIKAWGSGDGSHGYYYKKETMVETSTSWYVSITYFLCTSK